MRISGYSAPMPPAAADDGDDSGLTDDVANEIDGALMVKANGQAKAEGEAALALIDAAAKMPVGVNCPLSEGTVGRLINIKI